jgi:hypothetical protein
VQLFLETTLHTRSGVIIDPDPSVHRPVGTDLDLESLELNIDYIPALNNDRLCLVITEVVG